MDNLLKTFLEIQKKQQCQDNKAGEVADTPTSNNMAETPKQNNKALPVLHKKSKTKSISMRLPIDMLQQLRPLDSNLTYSIKKAIAQYLERRQGKKE